MENKKNIIPKILQGEIYFYENEKIFLEKPQDFATGYETAVDFNYVWKLSRGVVIPDEKNERIKFDIIPDDKDIYQSYFTGFLYPDEGKIIGRVKFAPELKEPDCKVNGFYEKNEPNEILIRGIWEDANGVKEGFWACLFE